MPQDPTFATTDAAGARDAGRSRVDLDEPPEKIAGGSVAVVSDVASVANRSAVKSAAAKGGAAFQLDCDGGT